MPKRDPSTYLNAERERDEVADTGAPATHATTPRGSGHRKQDRYTDDLTVLGVLESEGDEDSVVVVLSACIER